MKSYVRIRTTTHDGTAWENVMTWHGRTADQVRDTYRNMHSASVKSRWETRDGDDVMVRERCIHGPYGDPCQPVVDTITFHNTDPNIAAGTDTELELAV